MTRHLITTCLEPGDTFPVNVHPAREGQEATAFLHFGNLTALVSDPAVLDTLAAAVIEARDRLAAEITGQAPLPVDPPKANPYLTPGPLPVGVS
jgi:hypothetical protein